MIKTLRFNDSEVTINDSNGWLYDYREQFGEDFMVTVYQVLAGSVESAGELRQTDGTVDTDVAVDLLANLSAINSTVVSDVLWAMAHNADPSIPAPRDFANQYDGFPVDEIGIPLLESILSSFMSKKKVQRITEKIREMGQSISISLPSLESTED